MLLRQKLEKKFVFYQTQAHKMIYGKTRYFRQKADDVRKTYVQ